MDDLILSYKPLAVVEYTCAKWGKVEVGSTIKAPKRVCYACKQKRRNDYYKNYYQPVVRSRSKKRNESYVV